jgi:hypothetical protein
MTSNLHFELFMRDLRARAAAAEPKQLSFAHLQLQEIEDVGELRLSQIEAALRGARADTPGK